MVSPGLSAGSTQPRSFYPLGLVLSELPGFSEYEFTYSRVRVLSCTATIVNDQPGIQELYGGFAIAPSHDYVQSQLQIPQSSPGTSLLYRNIAATSSTNVGQHYGFRVGSTVLETNNLLTPSSATSVSSGVVTSNSSTRVIRSKTDPSQLRVLGSGNAVPTGWEIAPNAGTDAYQVEVPLSSISSADLPPATQSQISQLKRYRVRFPNTTKRAFRVRFVPYTFLAGSGPVTNLDLQQMPKFFSARRWMPLQWFSTAGGKSPLSLFGPFVAPLFAPDDVTQPINVSVYFHVRLQFAGQV